MLQDAVRQLSFVGRLLATVVLGSAALAMALALVPQASRSLRDASTPIGELDVAVTAPPARSIVYDRYGGVMGSFALEDRQPVPLADVPRVLVDAVIAIEDQRFFEHNGVDWTGTARALLKNVGAGEAAQGGSTITQQLVKNTLSASRERNLNTKAREAVLALRLERELTKNQILENYLNVVYFGSGAYGVQAAAERYFDRPVSALQLPGAALLAGVIQAPEALNPVRYPDRARARRAQVLDAMVAQGKITRARADAAKAKPLPTEVSFPVPRRLDYYLDEVKNRLLNNDPDVEGDIAERLGAVQEDRSRALYRGGLRIYTAYDPFAQVIAQRAVDEILPESEFTASLVVVDNETGGVRAMANGRTFAEMQFNPAVEGPGRQAGSAFKTFTLVAALQRGYSPSDTVSASPVYPWAEGRALSGDCYGGTPSLERALAASDNCAFVRLEQSLGPGNGGRDGVKVLIDTARSMGVESAGRFDASVLSTTLGTQGVHPLEMAQAYSVLPNDGVLRRAHFIERVVAPDDTVLFRADTEGTRVLASEVARTAVKLLEGPVRRGTAAGTLGGFPRPASGKTGTTDNNVDAWFVGFTPQYTAAVWMGDPRGELPMVGLPSGPVFGAGYPARIWREFMLGALGDLPDGEFAEPDRRAWPSPRYVSERGRQQYYVSEPTTTVPAAPTVDPGAADVTAPTSVPSPPTTGGGG
ncbi:MAG: transglycosylase domain-containing protein [Actinomycetota bacterium]